jgi:16S rRNA (guanine527-N7)-methyltransferase
MDRELIAERLNALLRGVGLEPLDVTRSGKFADYLALLMKWNARMNLTSIRDEEGILDRHFVECIACARALPEEIDTLLDFGSGAGFPGIPIAICRPEIQATLAESQGKKAAFLQEAVRVLGLESSVYSERAERLRERFDCVTLRAVDQMERAVEAAGGLVRDGGWLALMTTGSSAELKNAVGENFTWLEPIRLIDGSERLLRLGKRKEG